MDKHDGPDKQYGPFHEHDGPFYYDEGQDLPWWEVALAFVLVVIFFLFAGAMSRAEVSWGPTGCPTAQVSVDTDGSWYLATDGYHYQRGKGGVVASWEDKTGKFWAWEDKRWVYKGLWAYDGTSGWKSVGGAEAGVKVPNFGVDLGRLQGPKFETEKGTINREEAVRLIQETSPIPDDSGKYRLTVVGEKVFQERVMSELGGLSLDQFVVKAVSPAHWWVRERLELDSSADFQRTHTAVVLQESDGTAVHTQFDWAAGDGFVIAAAVDWAKIPNIKRDMEAAQGGMKDLASRLEALLGKIRGLEDMAAKAPETQRQVDSIRSSAQQIAEKLAGLEAQFVAINKALPDIRADIGRLAKAGEPIVWFQDHGDEMVLMVVVAAGLVVAALFLSKKRRS